jgi:hypothetical protein
MMKKIVALAGLGLAAHTGAMAAEFYKPYAEPHVNALYNLLFCDDPSLFRSDETSKATDGPWATLLAEKADEKALQALADDEKADSRVRVLAYNRLRAAGHKVPAKKVLGVVVEVPLQQGLDVLAAYEDGTVRYLNQSGKISIFEHGPTKIDVAARQLVAISGTLVEKIGPWDKQRLPPPKGGNVRLTFLVSDGLYFGEGPFESLQRDPFSGPVLGKAAQLLRMAVDTSLQQ